jgi:hypothetical protein
MSPIADLIERLTTVYRRGEEVEQRQVGSLAVTEFYGYPHTTEAAGDETLVDLVFVNVGVHIKEARALRDAILEALPTSTRAASSAAKSTPSACSLSCRPSIWPTS